MVGDKIKRIKTYIEGTHGFLIEADDYEDERLICCKDCKHYKTDACTHKIAYGISPKEDYYCADAVSKPNDAVCPYYQGVCRINEMYVCCASSLPNACNIYKKHMRRLIDEVKPQAEGEQNE